MMEMAREDGRAWCFEFQYEGKAPCFMGTAFVRLGAQHHEIEVACWKLWESIFPADLRRPRLMKLIPGQIVFLPEDKHPLKSAA